MNPWAKRGIIAAVVALALAAAFVGGRFSAPLKVQERTVEKMVYQDRVVEKRVEVQVAAKERVKVVFRDRVITKDGTVTEHEVERTDTDTHTTTKVDDAKVEVREVEKIKEVVKSVTLRPDWRVSVAVGASLHEPFVPIAGPLVLGAEVDRRIVGGFSVGVWINTSGAAGGAASFEF